MANHKSAWKRKRQNEKKRAQNRTVRGNMRTQVKKARAEIQAGGASNTEGEVKKAIQALANAGRRGILHKKTAARRISRLMKAANKSQQG
jgi:small subunit ribosomal protein S20